MLRAFCVGPWRFSGAVPLASSSRENLTSLSG